MSWVCGCKYIFSVRICDNIWLFIRYMDVCVCVCARTCVRAYAYKSARAVGQSEHITQRRGKQPAIAGKKRLFLHFHINEQIC